MLPDEQLNDYAAHEIDALEASGIFPSPAEVVKLNALGWAIESPSARRELSRGVPVMLCPGTYLWPLSIQASDWYNRVGERLCPSRGDLIRHPILSQDLPTLALAYAMAHCYSEGNELDVDGEDASRAVLAWASRLKCTAEGLVLAIREVVLQQDSPDLPRDADGREMAVGDLSAYLAATCGESPDFWERRCCVGYAVAVMSTIVKQKAADGKPLANDPKIVALRAFGLEVDRMKADRAVPE